MIEERLMIIIPIITIISSCAFTIYPSGLRVNEINITMLMAIVVKKVKSLSRAIFLAKTAINFSLSN